MHAGFSIFNRLLQSDPLPLIAAALVRSNGVFPDEGLPIESMPLPILDSLKAGNAKLYSNVRNPRLEHAGTELRNFLGPEIPVIEGWKINYRASEGLRIVTADKSGASGLMIENADIVSLEQTFPVAGEKHYQLEIDAAWQVSPDNRTRVQLNWLSINGERLRTDIVLRIPNGSSEGVQPLRFLLESPINAYDMQLGIVANRQYEGDYLQVERIGFGEFLDKL